MDKDFDFFRLTGQIWRRKWLVLLCGIVAGVAGWALSHLQATSYTASSDLLFKETNTFSPERTAATDLALASLTQVLIAVKQDLHTHLSIDDLRSRVDVTPQGQADLVRISGHAPTAAGAVRLTNTFANAVVAARRARAQAADQRQFDVLNQQIATTPPNSAFAAALVARRRSLQVSQALETGGVQVVAPAVPPLSPSSPKPVRNGIIAGFLGLLIGAVLVLTLRRYGRRMTTKELSEILGVPVLAEIPLSGRREWRRQRHLEAFHMLRVGLSLAARRAGENPSPQAKAGSVATSPGGYAIAITSALAGDGKTTVTANVAVALASADESVAAVDVDLRNPALAHSFGMTDGRLGIADVLVGDVDIDSVLRETSTPGLTLISGGIDTGAAVSCATPARLATVVAQLRSRASLVLLDTAPVPISAETSDVAAVADGVVLVVDTRVATRSDLEATRDQLTRAGAKLIGVVVNRTEPPEGKRHGYGYGGRYRYGTPVRRGTPRADPPDAGAQLRPSIPGDAESASDPQATVVRRSAPEI